MAEVSVPLLLQSYREEYSADPVTEQDFGELVDELRRKCQEAAHQHTRNTNAAHATQDRPVTKQMSPTNNNNDEHETMDKGDGNSGPHPPDVFAEFVNGWRNLLSNNKTSSRRPQRKLDVLSWGFGE